MFKLDVFTFDIAEIAECLPKDAQINVFLLGAAGVPEDANNRNFVRGALRPCRNRPCRLNAEKGDELPPSHERPPVGTA